MLNKDTSKPKHRSQSGAEENRLQGHWLLAKMGKKVLRPGGLELTTNMLTAAKPAAADRVVEFGPGVGKTAAMLLAANPKSYRGIDPNPEGAPALLQILARYPQAKLIVANALETTLEDKSADLVVGEAMLTMHSPKEKEQIVLEAFRVLAPGGRYAIHELGFRPDNCPEEVTRTVAKQLSRSIKVGARPLTMAGWKQLLEKAGFKIEFSDSNDMALLDPRRIIADESLTGALKFLKNIVKNKPARERIMAMRKVFTEHKKNLCAVALVARKPK